MKTLGIDLGGTKIAAAIVEDGKILAKKQNPTPQTGFLDVISAIIEVSSALLQDYPEVKRAGIGSPGPLDLHQGKVVFAANIPGFEDVPIVDALKEGLGLEVSLENDANAAGYAEHLYGAARGLNLSIYITLSTGIGGGIFIGKEILHGKHGMAGEIGHITLNSTGPVGSDGHFGSWETMAAGRGIARDASYVYNHALSTEEVFEKAKTGEQPALKIIDNAAYYTGIGIANLVKIFDPDGFVVGGGMSQVGDFYLDKIRSTAQSFLVGYAPLNLRMAELGTDAGVIGAASVALLRD